VRTILMGEKDRYGISTKWHWIVEGMAIIPLVHNDVKPQSVFRGPLLKGFQAKSAHLGLIHCELFF
jgi:hypothetical protein